MSAGVQLARLRKVLSAARRTAYYPPLFRAAALDSPRAVAALSSVGEALQRLPVVPLATFLARREEFRNRWWWRPRFHRVPTTLGAPPLSEVERERLWEITGMPVYEEIRGFDGELLARECEAHCGMHVNAELAWVETVSGDIVVTSLSALEYPTLRLSLGRGLELDRRLCACGQAAMRLQARVLQAQVVAPEPDADPPPAS